MRWTEVWQPTKANPCIINLPSTVEHSTPNIFADMIEWMHRNLKRREGIVLSVHPHNDRGTGTADGELAMMAGVDRVEGCLFGNGERTGNVDVVNLALNMYSQGVHPGLDFSDIDEVRRASSSATSCRCIRAIRTSVIWCSPRFGFAPGRDQEGVRCAQADRYLGDALPADRPARSGPQLRGGDPRELAVGKGGISYLLEAEYGLNMPRRLQIEFSQVVQEVTDATGKEVTAADIWNIFSGEYLGAAQPYGYVAHFLVEDSTRDEVELTTEVMKDGAKHKLAGRGNGPIDAFVQALAKLTGESIAVVDYHEHAITKGADAKAVTYIELKVGDSPRAIFGVGIDSNIVTASLKAILSGLNRVARQRAKGAAPARAVA